MEKQKRKDCYDLWKHCFHDGEEYMEYYFEEKMKDNQVLTLYEGEILTSMVHLNPYSICLNHKKSTANYIVGVATHSDYRKQGRMRILLEESLQNMYQEGQAITYLMPAAENIYLPFDFRYIYAQQRQSIRSVEAEEETQELQAAQLQQGLERYSLEELAEDKITQLCDYVNQKLDMEFDLYVVRTQEYYQRLQKEMKAAGGEVLTFYRQGNLIGVVAYMMEEGKAEVAESILETAESTAVLEQLFQRLNRKSVDGIEIEFLETYFIDSDVLSQYQPDSECKNKPIIMARIVNLEAFIDTFSTQRTEHRIIEVLDPIIQGNQGVWNISCSPNGSGASKTCEEPECTMTIYELLNYFIKDKKVYINEIV